MRHDLRDWLKKAEAIGKLKRIEGADWDQEIGAVTALNLKRKDCPALLFDNIKGYPGGYRVLTSACSTASLAALVFNLPVTDSDLEVLGSFREKLPQWEANMHKFPPQVVNSGPVLENVLSGDKVDLFKFPVPKWHSLDGGRYIGTGDAIITRDPDTGEINLGTYRVQVLSKRTTGLYMDPIKHGDIHRAKYHARGKPCPVAVSVGHHPLIFRVGAVELPPGAEYSFAGAIMGEPVKVIEEEVTGLPIPADSEIVLAGWCHPDKFHSEGPYGEWTGYYGRKTQSPVIEVERIYHRNEPVLLGSPDSRPPSDASYGQILFRSALLHNILTRSGIPDIKAVWLSREVNGPPMAIISLKQRYSGHAKQAAVIACQLRMLDLQGRFVVVVDDDIDPTNTSEVLWAMCSRVEPAQDIDIIRGTPSTILDARVPRDARTRDGRSFTNSRAIINACKPYEWIDEFPKSIDLEPEMVKRIKAKWSDLLE
ncbi:MAG: UbiD family decarboxylase [Chloroflexi bacterium]|nr:UbiD family decarboxylase [Chloroflexota bacterium]